MYVRCIWSWRLPGHSRHSPCPLSSLKGFTLELLNVSYVCMRTAAGSSARTAVAGRSLLSGISTFNRLGILWRSLVVTCKFVPRRNRKLYWWYVVQPVTGGCVCVCDWLKPQAVRHAACALCYVISIGDDSKCHGTLTPTLLSLLVIARTFSLDKRETDCPRRSGVGRHWEYVTVREYVT